MDEIIFSVGMQVEFDDEKNEINYDKHGFSLKCAQDIVESITLFGKDHYIMSDGYIDNGEQRYMMLAEYSGVIVLIAFTWRNGTMRVISFRKAKKGKEVSIFYDHVG